MKLTKKQLETSKTSRERIVRSIGPLEVLGERQGHPVRTLSELNKDGSVDVELRLYEWSSGRKAGKEFQEYVTRARIKGSLPKGTKVATFFSIDPQYNRRGDMPAPKSYLNLYQGVPAIALKYRLPTNYPELLVASQNALEHISENGWKANYIAFRFRYEQPKPKPKPKPKSKPKR